ncbi:MAG: monofunctional biosynthetic peptidoglycan transglycosylase [Chitinophagales bacterium]
MKKTWQKVWKWTKRLTAGFFVLSIVSTILFRFIPVPLTPLMVIRCVEQVAGGEAPRLKKDWVPLKDMSSNLVLAVISSEDQKFSQHFGFDFEAIEKVAKQNVKLQKRGKPIKGGSTISQQCAKNVFLFPQRSYIRKAFEVYFTFLIEVFWSKKRIMEVYLNVIEMGDGIYGAQAASKTFFKKDAKNLTAAEAATIAAVLPNPRKWNAGKPTGFINRRKNWILRQMGHLRGTVQL